MISTHRASDHDEKAVTNMGPHDTLYVNPFFFSLDPRDLLFQ